MKYKIPHIRFGNAIPIMNTMVYSWDVSRCRPGEECIYDDEKDIYLFKLKDEVWQVHSTNVTTARRGEKIDPMAKARAARKYNKVAVNA